MILLFNVFIDLIKSICSMDLFVYIVLFNFVITLLFVTWRLLCGDY